MGCLEGAEHVQTAWGHRAECLLQAAGPTNASRRPVPCRGSGSGCWPGQETTRGWDRDLEDSEECMLHGDS